MLTVWKFEVEPPTGGSPVTYVQMPEGAELLAVVAGVEADEERIYVYARVNPSARAELRPFAVYGTGHNHDGRTGAYVGTADLSSHFGGRLAFHVFELRAER